MDGVEEVGRCGRRLRREGVGGGRRREEGGGKEEVAVWENQLKGWYGRG